MDVFPYTILIIMKDTMKKQNNKPNYKSILAFFGATLSLIGCALYEYHGHVQLYRPYDVSDTIGLYAATLSAICWIAYLILPRGRS